MKQTSGINRFIRQLISLSFALIIFITAYNIFTNYTLKKVFILIRKVFMYSFLIISLYSLLEVLILVFNFRFLMNLFSLFDYFPFTETSLDFNFKRISSVSYEPPFLAIYLITVAGWMFSYILTEKGIKKYIPTIIVLLLTFFSGSRTALIVVVFQFFVFLGITFTINKNYRILIRKFILLIIILTIPLFIFKGKNIIKEIDTKIASLKFQKNLSKNISNKSRFGIQYTSLLIFSENPTIGVGFGQQAYHARNKYPKWATHNNYEFKEYYLNENEKSFPPGFNLYTRLLAETGFIGFIIFISFIFLLFYQCKKLIKKRINEERIIPIVLLVSFIGFAINWLQFDSFRVFGFWISLALLITQLQRKRIYNE